MSERGNPLAVRVGPGKLYIGAVGAEEPDDLATPWNEHDWTLLGYTAEGSTVTFDQNFEDVEVAEELEPVQILQTKRTISVKAALAEVTAINLERAFNGGDVQTPTGLVTFEPPPAGDFHYVALGWEAEDNLERMVFRKCIQTGSVEMARRRAPDKATIPVDFRAVKPPSATSFLYIQDADYVADES